MRRKHMLLLTPVLLGLLLIAVSEQGGQAIGKAGKRVLLAMLADPLSLFNERSPGERGAGVLLSTKSALAPHEPVLFTAGDHEIPPEMVNPIFSAAPEFPPLMPAAFMQGVPRDQYGRATPYLPIFPSPFRFSGEGPPARGTPLYSSLLETPLGALPPEMAPPVTPPPQFLLPGSSIPAIIPIPEPATWTIMLLGLLAFGVRLRATAMRR